MAHCTSITLTVDSPTYDTGVRTGEGSQLQDDDLPEYVNILHDYRDQVASENTFSTSIPLKHKEKSRNKVKIRKNYDNCKKTIERSMAYRIN